MRYFFFNFFHFFLLTYFPFRQTQNSGNCRKSAQSKKRNNTSQMHVTHGAPRRVKWFRHAAQLKQQQQLRQQLKQCNMCSQYKTELKACQQLGSCEPAVHPPTPLQRWSAQTQTHRTRHSSAQLNSTLHNSTQHNNSIASGNRLNDFYLHCCPAIVCRYRARAVSTAWQLLLLFPFLWFFLFIWRA